MFKKVLKKLGIISMLSVMVIGGFVFSGETKASAATYGGSPNCFDYGYGDFPGYQSVIQPTVHWKYSQGTCWQKPLFDGGSFYYFATNVVFWNNTANQPVMVYMDKWDGVSNWVQVAHTGSFRNMEPITTNSDPIARTPQSIEFYREYNQSLDPNGKYRMRFSVPNAIDYTDTSFYQWYLP